MDLISSRNHKSTADFLLNQMQRELLVAFKAQLEKSFNVELFIPKVENSFDLDVFAMVYGKQQDINSIKEFISHQENHPDLISHHEPETKEFISHQENHPDLISHQESETKEFISHQENHPDLISHHESETKEFISHQENHPDLISHHEPETKKIISSSENDLPSITDCNSVKSFSLEVEMNPYEENGDNCLLKFKGPLLKNSVSSQKNPNASNNTEIVKKNHAKRNRMRKKNSKNKLTAANKSQTTVNKPNKIISSSENDLPSITGCNSVKNFSLEVEMNPYEENGDNCLLKFKEPLLKNCVSSQKNPSASKSTEIVKNNHANRNRMRTKTPKNKLTAANKSQTTVNKPNAKKKKKLNSKCRSSSMAENISDSNYKDSYMENVSTTSQNNVPPYQKELPNNFQGDYQRNVIEVITLDSDLEIERPLTPCYLRPIVIDGSNIAREHGKINGTFSCKGIEICVQYFLKRGHLQVTAFVPHFRRHCNNYPPTIDASILEKLAEKQHVVFTPSRTIGKRLIASYDDRFIVECACTNGGVILSNDNFKDLVKESESFKKTIETRLLMYCFVGDIFMIPSDPMGRYGPSLEKFLSFPPGNVSSMS